MMREGHEFTQPSQVSCSSHPALVAITQAIVRMCSKKFRTIHPFFTLLKNRLQRSCFPMNFAKFLKTAFIEHLRRLLLQ